MSLEDKKEERLRLLKIYVVLMVFALIGSSLRCKFIMAPPLIVGFIEFTNTDSKVRKHPEKAFALFIIAIICSISLRLVLNIYLSLPLVIPAILSASIIIYAMNKIGMLFPPVGAMALLPMMIDYRLLGGFLIQASIGCLLLIVIAMNLFGKTELVEIND